MPSGKRAWIGSLALVLASLTIGYCALEIAYRVWLYQTLRDALEAQFYEATRASRESPYFVFDPDAGYRYAPRLTMTDTGGYLKNRWTTNAHGLIGNELRPGDYPLDKPADEFRVAVLGDSFAASNATYLRWTDFVEEALNADPAWRAFTGGKSTRVINFGHDGVGVVQMAAIHRHRARAFAPDLTVVNLITDDLTRRFFYRGQHSFASDADLRRHVREQVEARMLRPLPWFQLSPELFAATIGIHIGMSPALSLPAAASAGESHFGNERDSLAYSRAALREISCQSLRILVLHAPMYEESEVAFGVPRIAGSANWGGSRAFLNGLRERFGSAVAADGIPYEAARFDAGSARRLDAGKVATADADLLWRLQMLYNVPRDPSHLSDYGVMVYAEWAAARLVARASTDGFARGKADPCG